MRSSTARAVIAALAIIVSSVSLFAQTQSAAKTVKATGSVAGRVTIKNKPASGVAVGLRKPENYSPFESFPRAITDQDGNYKITNVVAGAYDVIPGAPAFILSDNNNPRGRSIVVGDGENVENINFALVRGGVITGKITDADQRPVIQQQVRLFRAEPPDPRAQPGRVTFPVNTVSTDDRGIYRMFGLTPGRYKVSIGRGDETSGSFNPIGRISYREVFYPDATEQAKAAVIEVSEGSEATNIDITLGRPIETFSATGSVIDGERGQPVPNVRFTMQRLIGERSEFMPVLITSNSRGEFAAEGLIPGKYGVALMTDPNSELRADSMTFDVIDSDVSGVTVRLVKGGSISGVVLLETEDKRAIAKLSQLQIQAYVQNPGGGANFGGAPRSTIGGDGSFRVGGLSAGTANLNLAPTMDMNQMKGFLVSRIERDGVIQPRGIEIKDGEQVAGIRIIVNYGSATLKGVVTVENGPLPPGSRIFVQLRKAGDMPLSIRPPSVDERGRFIADGIPGGSYELWVSVAGGNVRGRPPVKQQIVLQDGTVTDVAVTLDLAGGPKP